MYLVGIFRTSVTIPYFSASDQGVGLTGQASFSITIINSSGFILRHLAEFRDARFVTLARSDAGAPLEGQKSGNTRAQPKVCCE